MVTNYKKQALKLAGEILCDMAKTACCATDIEKREAICFLPRYKAGQDKCSGCQYWRG